MQVSALPVCYVLCALCDRVCIMSHTHMYTSMQNVTHMYTNMCRLGVGDVVVGATNTNTLPNQSGQILKYLSLTITF